MSLCTFEFSWESPYDEAFYFSGTIQLICGASQVSCFLHGMGFHCQEYSSRLSLFLF